MLGAPTPPRAEPAPPRASDAALVCEGDEPPRPDRLRVETLRREAGRYLADRESGASVELTLDPRLQAATEHLLDRPQIQYAASVLLSIPDGRVLALAGRSAADPWLHGAALALRSWAPAASVFKLVSAAALVEEAGLTGESRACYHGGLSAVRPDNLIDNPRRDRCASLAYGIGKSQNAILAKLAVRYLSPQQLARTGRALGFGETLEFDLPVEPSLLDVPEGDPLEFARTAAGFWHSTLSPLHGALLAAVIADGGRMVTPYLVERAPVAACATPAGGGEDAYESQRGDDDDDHDGDGDDPVSSASASASTMATPRQALSSHTAAAVAEMMAGVTRMGTARTAFHDRHGRSRLPFLAAGKTGTLYGKADRGFVGYSWFVGFAPVDHPTVAFAVALANKPGRRLRAADVARELLAEYASAGGPAIGNAVQASRAGAGAAASTARWASKRRHLGRSGAAARHG